MSATRPSLRKADASERLVLLIVCACAVLASLDLFIVNVALPEGSRDRGAPRSLRRQLRSSTLVKPWLRATGGTSEPINLWFQTLTKLGLEPSRSGRRSSSGGNTRRTP